MATPWGATPKVEPPRPATIEDVIADKAEKTIREFEEKLDAYSQNPLSRETCEEYAVEANRIAETLHNFPASPMGERIRSVHRRALEVRWQLNALAKL